MLSQGEINPVMLPHCRRKELPLALTAAGEPVRWQGVTPEGRAMRPANLTKQQYQQLLPLLFDGEQKGQHCSPTTREQYKKAQCLSAVAWA
jgi:hypothetical protein